VSALTGVYADGSVPLTEGAYVVNTGFAGGATGSVVTINVVAVGSYSAGGSHPVVIADPLGHGSGAAAVAVLVQEGLFGTYSVQSVTVTAAGENYSSGTTAAVQGTTVFGPAVLQVILGVESAGGGSH
jgi:hypothetical protein